LREKTSQFLEFPIQLGKYPGKYFLEYEQEQLNLLLPQLYGYYLVQLGVFDNYNLGLSGIMQHIYVGKTAEKDSKLCVIVSDFSELPFQSKSVDVFILPHTLEFVKMPSKLLHEIYNILIPGGKLIILGFNPFSLLGLTKLIRSKDNLWSQSLYSTRRVKRWLYSIGFSISYQKGFCFRPPLKNKVWLDKLSFLESWGKFFCPCLGSAFILFAQKEVLASPPVRVKASSQKISVRNGFPEPSTNKGL
jgi:SAM-dependent methyltransferase